MEASSRSAKAMTEASVPPRVEVGVLLDELRHSHEVNAERSAEGQPVIVLHGRRDGPRHRRRLQVVRQWHRCGIVLAWRGQG
jgi:hypothetical protein